VAPEQVLDVPVRRHLLTSERPSQVVLDGIYTGISQPDIGALFAKLAASTSYEEFSDLVRQVLDNRAQSRRSGRRFEIMVWPSALQLMDVLCWDRLALPVRPGRDACRLLDPVANGLDAGCG
jgi:hypothetical protein